MAKTLGQYIFGEGTPDTYESLKQKRLTAARLQQGATTAPRNIGEGLTALGQAIAYRRLMNDVNTGEAKGQADANSQYASGLDRWSSPLGQLMGGQLGGGAQPSVSTSGPTVPPVASAPITANPAGLPNDIIKAVDRVDPPIKNAYDLAARKIGLNEGDQKAALTAYMADGGVNLDPATRAWCADFVNATLAQTGQQGTGSSMARSFLDWGQPVDQPQKGDVAVFSRGDPNGPYGHVGFFDSYNPDGTINVLGGNQGDAVSMAKYSQDDLLGFRRAQQNVEEIGTLLSNPYLGEGQRAVLGQLLEQSIQAMQPPAPPDPMAAIELQKAQLELEQMQNPQPANGTEYGLQPIIGTDANGNPVVMQLGKNGTAVLTDIPDGVTPDMGALAYDRARGAAAGKAVGEATGALPQATATANLVSEQIQSLKDDPYLPNMLGPVDSRLPNVSEGAARVQAKMDQLQGGAFLQARTLLKGGGQITDFEGKKAEEAFVRMNAAQSVEDYKKALDDFDAAVKQGIAKLEQQAGKLPGVPSNELSDEDLFKQYGIGP